ncbi:MAG: hypothetical protein ACI4TL_03355 [Candidatus Cryptobacteroides sp.]
MRYFIRSIKYFLYLCIVLLLFILILSMTGFIEGDIEHMFIHGYTSLLYMAAIVAVFAAIYPMLGYGKRNVRIKGESAEIEPELVKFMQSRHYVLCDKKGEDLTFRKASVLDRIVKMGEDKVRFTRVFGGYTIEGLTKDIVRLDTGLSQFFEPEGE